MASIILKSFPKLYKRTSLRAVRHWLVDVVSEGNIAYVCKQYGQMGGATTTYKTISVGKLGRDQYQQAIYEAELSWNEKINKEGYVTDVNTLNNIDLQLTIEELSFQGISTQGLSPRTLFTLSTKNIRKFTT